MATQPPEVTTGARAGAWRAIPPEQGGPPDAGHIAFGFEELAALQQAARTECFADVRRHESMLGRFAQHHRGLRTFAVDFDDSDDPEMAVLLAMV